MDRFPSLSHCFSGMARVALQPKVHMVETDGLFPIHSSNRDISGGSVEWGMMFLLRAAWQRAYGHAVHLIDDLTLSSIAIVILTIGLSTCSTMPCSCDVSDLAFSWPIPSF